MAEQSAQDAPKFSDTIVKQAEALVTEHGAEVENATTEMLIEVLDRGNINEIVLALRVRQCIRLQGSSDRYTRRLPDKIVWAVEQAIEQGRISIAKLLGRAYKDAKTVAEDFEDDRRGEVLD